MVTKSGWILSCDGCSKELLEVLGVGWLLDEPLDEGGYFLGGALGLLEFLAKLGGMVLSKEGFDLSFP